MKTHIKIGSRVCHIEISELNENLIKVDLDGSCYFFSKNELGELIQVTPGSAELQSLGEKTDVFLETLAEKEIKTPIAGTISTIEVRKGENVKPGQKVATLIAMKMENEIISETAGIVQDIKVKEGQTVNTGQILIVLE